MAETYTSRSEDDPPGRRRVARTLLFVLGRGLSYAYLLRVPLLTALAIVGLCAGAYLSGTRSLLGNIFDIDWTWGIFFVSWSAFLAGLVVMTTSRLVLLYGPERFFDGSRQSLDGAWPFVVRCTSIVVPIILMLVVALPVIKGALDKSTLSTGRENFEALLGFIASLACLLVVFLVRSLAFRLFGRSSARSRGQPLAQRITSGPRFRGIPEGVGGGYLEYEDCEAVSIRPWHLTALILAALTLIVYVAIGYAKYDGLGAPPLVPALSYVMLLMMLFCWSLSGAAFFLDRYRIPVLVPLVLWLALNTLLPWSDYSFPVTYPEQEGGGSSSDGPGAIGKDSGGKIIVVAANGGGIQAAAWAERVLAGLEEECRTKCGGSFGQSVHVISSVSGGSIGTMYFLNEYEDGRLPKDPGELEKIVDRTEGSSLDEISWGVLYPDLVRTFFPNPFVWNHWDRGRALEVAWLRRDVEWANRERIEQGLSTWRRDADDRDRPAAIFNTAVVETGQRLPLATTDLPKDSPGALSYGRYFEDVEPKPDIPIVTAARLSASFPYVSPAARAAVAGDTDHLVDGGYYDNYGISSLVEWLDDELEHDCKTEDGCKIKKVLIVEIRGARSGPGDLRTLSPECKTEPVVSSEPGSKPGWFSQILAPPQGALNVRNTGQRTHNDTELDLLQDKWKARDDVEITRALFEFDGANPPLSWHLTAEHKDEIERQWRKEIDDPDDSCKGWDRVRTFLAPQGKN